MSYFSQVQAGPPIEVFDLHRKFYEDSCQHKINLAIGAYRTDEGQPWVLPVVRTVEKTLASDNSLDKSYLPILGYEEFNTAATRLLLGENNPAIVENRAFGIQSVSGANALRIGAEFLRRILGKTTFYYSNPTWRSHQLIFEYGGFTDAREYRYWSEESYSLDFEGLIEDLKNAPEESVVILHACAHNPSGYDPTETQWSLIADVMKERKLFPFFDSALLGFASGDVEKDAFAVRFFVQRGFELFCAQSFSKNFGLYSERVGSLTVVVNNPELVAPIKSHITHIIRRMYICPPSFGSRIVFYILNDPNLYSQWKDNLQTMFFRISEIRKKLQEALERLGTPGDWSHITCQVGMVCSTRLTKTQCEYMMKKYHIYILSSGRVNICAITTSNVDYIAKGIYETIAAHPSG